MEEKYLSKDAFLDLTFGSTILFPFQEAAITEIRDKFLQYRAAPNMTKGKEDPFVQFLRAITGAGKTPILAGAINEISQAYNYAPLILWTSKTAAVIGQTLSNFDHGGKYRSLIPGFTVKDISNVQIGEILDTTSKLIITSTVASFNRSSKEGLNVFTLRHDKAGNISLWEALSRRNGKPLFIVYDEGHNTTDNQIDLLFELIPDAILLASATPKVTPRLHSFIKGNLNDQETIQEIATTVQTRYVVENELIKSTITLTDYNNQAEFIILDMVAQYREAERLAKDAEIAIEPKCIYVSATNEIGDQGLPFHQRTSRPISIWRTLVEKANIHPDDIAIYCSHKGEGFPRNFHLIRKFEELKNGKFKHIIFNLGLQEGWDDPEVYFAYIDKTLNSATEITQIIGRVLRQPNSKRTPYELLNSAHFFVNCPSDKFNTVIAEIRTQIGTHYNDPGNDYIRVIIQSKTKPEPLQVRMNTSITFPKLALAADPDVVKAMVKILNDFPDYGKLSNQAISSGNQQTTAVNVETGVTKELKKKTQGLGQMIKIGDLFRKELFRLSKDAAEALDDNFTNNGKFCSEICYISQAAKEVRSLAMKVADTYAQFIAIEPGIEEFIVPEFQPSSLAYKRFNNSLHEGYDALNPDEVKVAEAIDSLGYPWFRNLPNADGYKIPLPLVSLNARNFFPDFIVLGKKTIWCIDPKGWHLLSNAIRDKLVENIKLDNNLLMKVVLISRGNIQINGDKQTVVSKKGATLLWKRGPRSIQFLGYYEDYLSGLQDVLVET
ncbi:MAG: DEAD/DEAH box helicase family protein [Coleofasciculaceae cyanobacterium]